MRGQLTIIGIFVVFVGLIVFFAIEPVLSQVISDAALTGMAGFVAGLFPTMILLGLLVTLVIYLTPQRQQQF